MHSCEGFAIVGTYQPSRVNNMFSTLIFLAVFALMFFAAAVVIVGVTKSNKEQARYMEQISADREARLQHKYASLQANSVDN